jgi:hypothetical protein
MSLLNEDLWIVMVSLMIRFPCPQISQMRVDLVAWDLARLAWTRIGHAPPARVKDKTARFGAVGKPDSPTAPFGSSLG